MLFKTISEKNYTEKWKVSHKLKKRLTIDCSWRTMLSFIFFNKGLCWEHVSYFQYVWNKFLFYLIICFCILFFSFLKVYLNIPIFLLWWPQKRCSIRSCLLVKMVLVKQLLQPTLLDTHQWRTITKHQVKVIKNYLIFFNVFILFVIVTSCQYLYPPAFFRWLSHFIRRIWYQTFYSIQKSRLFSYQQLWFIWKKKKKNKGKSFLNNFFD